MEWINKGVGHMLIGRCINWTMKKGTRIIYTETGKDNKTAIEFYRKRGFKITGCIPEYYRKGLDAVILVRKLR
jgi:ribosomal protein S18 acetylase RimI-like enzyme